MRKFENYCLNLNNLLLAGQQELDNPFVVSGVISIFSLEFELGWKVLKELLQYEGRVEGTSGSPREILKASMTVYPFLDEEIWLAMLADRNSMTHVYDAAIARELVDTIIARYTPAFVQLRDEIQTRYDALLHG